VGVQVAAARVLLRHGADVNAQCPPRFDRRRAVKNRQTDRQTDTVITVLRCVRVQVAAARVLLRHGADVNAQCPPRFDRRRAVKNRQTDRQTR